jgi:glycosyltransferase involved in cell wall biosynthesis
MRVGQNPAKSIEHVPEPARVTVALLTYIPFLSGYYAESLEVLKTSLNSIWENTPHPYDLMVFDNASCSEVRAYLQEAQREGQIQYLVLSDKNFGKGGAWNLIFQGAPGEIISYADSDVYFLPGWLEKSLQILEAFPHVGMVSSRPLRTPQAYYTSTLEWAQGNPEAILEKGQFQTWEVFKEHNDSLGVSEETARQWFQESHDWRVEYHGCTAHIGAAHFQFVAPKSVLQTMAPFKMDRPMGQVRSLDQKLNEAGYLRLNTCEPLVKHLGNRLKESNAIRPVQRPQSRSISGPIFNLPLVRRSLLWLYDQIFRLYYSSKS